VRAAIEKIIAIGRKPRGIRLDSGDLYSDSVWARERLDEKGWRDVQIFASGDLTEERIAALLEKGAPINSFGVGTALSTSSDSPSVGVIYKLVEVQCGDQIRSTAKFSTEKKTYPGRKQVFRFRGADGFLSHDIVALEDEACSGAEPLLVQAMRDGQRLGGPVRSAAICVKTARSRFLANRECLPPPLLTLGKAATSYPVYYSARLEEMSEQLRHRLVQVAGVNPTEAADKMAASTT
jgi:nicotinate phosphoribosyltransferase